MGNGAVFESDVVVAGGGSAGVAAAVGAAAAGARVTLIERYGFLGGAATNSSVLTYCGFFDQTRTQVVRGAGQRFLDKLSARDVYRTQTMSETGNTVVLLDPEITKIALDELIGEANVTLLLHSTLIDATTGPSGVESLEIAHRGGRARIRARAFVDASGDGAVIAATGAAVVSPVGERQASTQVIRAGGIDDDADLSAAGMQHAVVQYEAASGESLVRTHGIAARLPISREVLLLLADQHRDALDVGELTRAELESRRLCWGYLAAFRRYLPGWQNAYLAATGPQIGIRESRRLLARYAVTADDVSSGRKRPADSIARCGWPMEHHVEPGVTAYGGIRDKGWYDIPYDAIRAASIPNLWAAGRLTGSDNQAYASLRVMGTSFATGHAAGVAAAVYADSGRHDLDRVRAELVRQGALI
ncbi:FAD-dependent oxidoreductase [Microbacterium kribbense]|uniref:FAD-dependent oxidoreductase n=1 Tax=Microbacterium kribbense TaxID=433645 RepID=A0ABP7FZ69_9MICO